MDENYHKILASINTPGGASIEAIVKSENELGISFPTSYRTFLTKYGAALGEGFEIAGVFTVDDDEPPLWRDVVLSTNQIRRLSGPNFPNFLIPISDNGMSVNYFLDVSDPDRSPVIALGPGNEELQVAQSFEEFVVKLSNGALDDFRFAK